MDRNSIIGFVLLALLMFGLFWYTSKQQNAYMEIQKHKEDSIARIKALEKQLNTPAAHLDSLRKDSAAKVTAAGGFSNAALGNEQFVTVENELLIAKFSTKGGRLESVQLKNYKSFDGKQVQLGNSKSDLGYSINTGNTSSSVNSLIFTPSAVIKNTDGSQTINFTLQDASGQSIVHQYTIKPNDYLIDWNINLTGSDKLLSNGVMNFAWKSEPQQNEKSVKYERLMSNICFSVDGSFDYISSHTEKKFEKPVQWFGVVQQFFNETIIAKNSFENGQVNWSRKTDSTTALANVDASLQMKVPVAASASIPLQLYFGPNDYYVLKKAAPKMDKIVNLGRDMYTFVRPVNEYIIMPVFNFLSGMVSNIGWAILLLTIFVRIITAPLTYSSYLSGAKMKVLRPELDALKAKFPDPQTYGMEQMKFYREAGVNPLGGCVPALVQLPVFVALYSFFNSNISVRGHSFLWASDLSLYDSIVSLPFHNISFLPDHLSLFTILAVAGQFFLSIYNMSMTPQSNDPNMAAMKYMPYIFPFMMFFIFNNLPSALTWYYTVSNLTIIIQQFIIQKFVINHDKILEKLNEKRKQPKKKSKWAERMEQIQESQKKMQELKNKTQQNKK